MIVKKFKKHNGKQEGVVQVKLKNIPDGSVVLEVVDEFGKRVSCGTMLVVSDKGVAKQPYFTNEHGFVLNNDKIADWSF